MAITSVSLAPVLVVIEEGERVNGMVVIETATRKSENIKFKRDKIKKNRDKECRTGVPG